MSTPLTLEDAPPKPSARRPGLTIFLWRIGLIAALLLAWQLSADRLFNAFWSSRPTDIFERLIEMAQSGELLRHTWATVLEAGLGLIGGGLLGVALGIVLARRPRVAQVTDPVIMGLYGLPRVALAPLFILWFGIGLTSKVMMALSMVVFVFLLNTAEGIRSIDPDLVDLMHTMRAGPLYLIRRVWLPAIVPWTIAATRIGIGLSLVGAVVGELTGANQGLGWYVNKSGGQIDTTGVFAGLTVLLIVAIVANHGVVLVERWALRWRR
jgi:NitT/TauT family transport system permease protein